MRLRLSPAAQEDLEAIFRWISVDNIGAARRVVGRILKSVDRLESFPEMGRPIPDEESREWLVSGLPYVAVYEIDQVNNEVIVTAIFHTSRDRN